jgi:hypothetical protein
MERNKYLLMHHCRLLHLSARCSSTSFFIGRVSKAQTDLSPVTAFRPKKLDSVAIAVVLYHLSRISQFYFFSEQARKNVGKAKCVYPCHILPA